MNLDPSEKLSFINLSELSNEANVVFQGSNYILQDNKAFTYDNAGTIHSYFKKNDVWMNRDYSDLQKSESLRVMQGSELKSTAGDLVYIGRNGVLNILSFQNESGEIRSFDLNGKDQILPNSELSIDNEGAIIYVGKDRFIRRVKYSEDGVFELSNLKETLAKKKKLGKLTGGKSIYVNLSGRNDYNSLFVNKKGQMRRIALDESVKNREINLSLPVSPDNHKWAIDGNGFYYFVDTDDRLKVVYANDPCSDLPCHWANESAQLKNVLQPK